MQIIIARLAGFCGGVKRAIDIVEKELKKSSRTKRIKIFGELVHNKQVMNAFRKEGIKMVDSLTKISPTDKLIIRAHGVPHKIIEDIEKKEINYIDATCPKVKKTQELVKDLEEKGYKVIIFGDPKHSEVQTLLGFSKKGKAISSPEEARKITRSKKLALVAQSTSKKDIYEIVKRVLRNKCEELSVQPTFCDFTTNAQKEAEGLAKKVDIILVLGGRHSSNTKRLFEKSLPHAIAYHIEDAPEIRIRWFKNVKKVGITAGASTPPEVVERVIERLKGIAELM